MKGLLLLALFGACVNGPTVAVGDASGQFDDLDDACTCELFTIGSRAAQITCSHADLQIPLVVNDTAYVSDFDYADLSVGMAGVWTTEGGHGLFLLDTTQVPDPRGDPYLLVYERFYLQRLELAGGMQHCDPADPTNCISYVHSTARDVRIYCTYDGGPQ